MEDRQKQAQGNSFLLGVIVGVLLTLLFTTHKGRAIAKEIMEKGVHKLADLEKILQEMQFKDTVIDDFDLDPEGNDYIPEAKAIPTPIPTPEPKVVKKTTTEVKVQQEPSVIKENVKPVIVHHTEKKIEKIETAEEMRKKAAEAPLIEKEAETVSLEPIELEKVELASGQKEKEGKPRRWFHGLRKKS